MSKRPALAGIVTAIIYVSTAATLNLSDDVSEVFERIQGQLVVVLSAASGER